MLFQKINNARQFEFLLPIKDKILYTIFTFTKYTIGIKSQKSENSQVDRIPFGLFLILIFFFIKYDNSLKFDT